MYVTLTVKQWLGSNDNPSTPDKNNKMPLFLKVLNGKYPNRNILSGTVAEREGFQVGKAYLASWVETEPDAEYGRQFQWTMVKELTMVETIQSEMIGKAEIFKVEEVIAPEDSTLKNKTVSLTE